MKMFFGILFFIIEILEFVCLFYVFANTRKENIYNNTIDANRLRLKGKLTALLALALFSGALFVPNYLLTNFVLFLFGLTYIYALNNFSYYSSILGILESDKYMSKITTTSLIAIILIFNLGLLMEKISTQTNNSIGLAFIVAFFASLGLVVYLQICYWSLGRLLITHKNKTFKYIGYTFQSHAILSVLIVFISILLILLEKYETLVLMALYVPYIISLILFMILFQFQTGKVSDYRKDT